MSVLRELPRFQPETVSLPHTISGMSEQLQHDTHWTPHSHPVHELCWNRHGTSMADIGARHWIITPSHGLWIPAGTVHGASAAAGTIFNAAMFDVNQPVNLPAQPTAVKITPLLALLLERLSDPGLTSSSREITEAMVLDVLTPALTEFFVTIPSDERLRAMVQQILHDPADSRSLNEWSEQLGLSTKTVTRILAQQAGLTFSQWKLAVRCQHAIRLLSEGYGAEYIAEQVGYHSVSAFGAAFKQATGMTPGQMRHQVASTQDTVSETR